MVKTFFIPNKQSILGQQEILTAKSVLALVDGLESHSYDAVYLRQPLNRLEYIECGIIGKSQFLFKVRYVDAQKGYQVIVPDLITRADWVIVEALLQALSSKVGESVEGLSDFDLEDYFQETVKNYLADKDAHLVFCQGILSTIYFDKKDLESFLEEDGLARFEALVKKVQESDAYPASAKFYPDGEGKIHGIYHLAQGVKTILPKGPVVPVPYVEQLAGKELIWEIDLVKISGDGSKPEDYEAVARLDYQAFLEVLPKELCQDLDANQVEVGPVSGEDFEALANR
ncbi:DUF4299 family protein [Streptococcus sp. BJSWXB6CM1]|uniref:DUF4299 family protein n=1 Tax=Streptococcus fermentans TaxID=3095082 RepID=A0ABU5G191_9STRE|nr:MULTISPECIES: DUF4299 family protein [unclassified Streptococcus]MDY4346141.1 DUF4299 family protein [Streptococcus sp. BJSWXB5TM5]MDY4361126.1 DUF4299 family protein [Streptococcus sp. BJSWXB3CM3]MDY4371283.1 DUF4299 family protein [Streptococcus sp. BJSWXB6CM1]